MTRNRMAWVSALVVLSIAHPALAQGEGAHEDGPSAPARAVAVPALEAQTLKVPALEVPALEVGAYPGSSYFLDGGAVPFLYGSLAVTAGIRLFVEPPSTPRVFGEETGGRSFSNTVPEWMLGIYGASLMALIALPDYEGRYYHAKGYAEALATTLAITEIVKNIVGRRPHFQDDDNTPDHRRSFFSGHSSVTLVTTLYAGMVLRNHIFPTLRAGDPLPLWEVASYAGLATVAYLVPASRVADNRHHVSDVVVGGAVGMTIALAFYSYQERRLRKARRADRVERWKFVPTSSGVGVVGQF